MSRKRSTSLTLQAPIFIALAFAAFLCSGAASAQNPKDVDTWSDDLRKAGIEPDPPGVRKFLESLRLTAEREAQLRALLGKLGSEHFPVREKAMLELLTLPYIPHHLLKDAAEKDLETKRRVQTLQDQGKFAECESRALLAARFIQEKRLKGFTLLLLDLMPQWQDEHLLQVASRAAATSAEREDAKALRGALGPKRFSKTRAAAAAALAEALGRDAEKELIGLLDDADTHVSLAAATGLLQQENRRALTTLVRLLDAEPMSVRQKASAILTGATGQKFGYVSYEEPKNRADAVAAWRAWVDKEGANAKLLLPLRLGHVPVGRIVIADFSRKTVCEIDMATHKTLFEAGAFAYLWGADGTPEGHRLAADYSGKLVVEYDRQGKQVWQQTLPGNPTSVERLPNGLTLIALAEQGRVVEIDRTGKLIWDIPLTGRPTTAQRLENGNTLVCLQYAKKVVEINRQGGVVWELAEGLAIPHTAQQLDNGNVLIADFGPQGNRGVVQEFNRKGKLVWTKNVNNPAQAQRLPNGHTLVCGAEGLLEFDAAGNLVRQLKIGRSKFFAY